MARVWEVRGLFGNEFAMEQAIEELRKHKGFEWEVLDRRNLSVRFAKRDPQTEAIVRRTFEIAHGWVEAEGPLGQYDKKIMEVKAEKLRKEEEKRAKRKKQLG